jgi:putative peptidoglycan lipid II flippase
MKISIFCLCLNLVFALMLVQRFREVGLGVANTISSVFNASLLLYALRKKLSRLQMADLRRHLIVLFVSAIASGAAAWLAWKLLDERLGHATFRVRLVAVFVPMAIGCGVCFGIALLLRVPYVSDIFALLPMKFRGAKPNPPA